MKKKTILIFGASSFVGSNFMEALKNDFRIIGTYHQTVVDHKGVMCLPCDVLKKDHVTKLVSRLKPNVIIYAVGNSSIRKSQLNLKECEELNSVGAVNCAIASDRISAKFIYLSSAFIFKSQEAPYLENEPPLPESQYGKSVSSMEFYLQRSCLSYLILRCSALYGRSYHPHKVNWFEQMERKLHRGEQVVMDDSIQTGLLDVRIVANFLKTLLHQEVSNRLFHVSSKDFMTRYEFAKIYANIFKHDVSRIQKSVGIFSKNDSVSSNAKKSIMMFKLDSSNLQNYIHTPMPTIEDSLRFTQKRFSLTG